MLGWLRKRRKVELVKAELGLHKCADVYPDAMIRDIVDATFEMTKGMAQSSARSASFDFDGNWNWFLLPFIRLLFTNWLMIQGRGSRTDAQVREVLARFGQHHYADIDPLSAEFLSRLLIQYGFQNHIEAIMPLLKEGIEKA